MANDIRDLADEEVMQLVQSGDPRAFELLYDRHGGAAFSLAYRMVGKRVTAEDITQEAFLSIWRSRLRYDQARGSVRTWVLGIVHNRAIDALRRYKVHDRRQEVLEGVEERHEAKERTDVEAARREEARNIRGALDTLPDDQRRTIELGLLRRLQPQPDSRVARRAHRYGEGPHAARPRQDAAPALGGLRGGGIRMSARDHESYSQEVGAYLLGALTDLERQAFERHMAGCAQCRDEVERLRPAADALPRSVEQLAPPPGLKASIMDVVEQEARETGSAPAASRKRRRSLMPRARRAAPRMGRGRARVRPRRSASASPSSAATTADGRSWPPSTIRGCRRRADR